MASVVAAACSVTPSKDDVLRDHLVGKWAEARHFDNAHEQQSIELSRDGHVRIEQACHDGSGTKSTVRQGRWRVEGGDFDAPSTLSHCAFSAAAVMTSLFDAHMSVARELNGLLLVGVVEVACFRPFADKVITQNIV